MARADNSPYLAQANARRHQAALSAAHRAIQQLQRQGQTVSFSTVTQSAGISRGWLYRPPRPRRKHAYAAETPAYQGLPANDFR